MKEEMGKAAGPVGPHVPTELELEHWHFERECTLRELALKEREQANRDADIELRRDEQRAATWRSPLTVAIFAAAVAGAGNAIVALLNGSQQRELESRRHLTEVYLERTKAESIRILEMIKTGDSEKAASNLDFLIKSGLVTDESIQNKLATYLASRKPGTGPSLPSQGNSRIGFDDDTSANRSLREQLQARLNDFVAFLDRIGFPPSKEKVIVHLEDREIDNAYYENQRIVIDRRLADDPSVALREYGHHILTGKNGNLSWEGQYSAIESGLADYFACSFLNNPKFGEKAARVLKIGRPQVRQLQNQRTYADFASARIEAMAGEGGEIWGGLFWALRVQLGRDPTDKLLAAAWTEFEMPAAEGELAPAFVRRLIASAAKQGRTEQMKVRAALQERKFPLSD